MSDFLTRLAARAIGEHQEIRPRTASIFEPVGQPTLPTASTEAMGAIETPQKAGDITTPSPLPTTNDVAPLIAEKRSVIFETQRLVDVTAQARIAPLPPEPTAVAQTAAGHEPDFESTRTEDTVRIPTPEGSSSRLVVENRQRIEKTLRREHIIREETITRRPGRDDFDRRAEPASMRSEPFNAVAPQGARAPLPEPPVTVEVTIGRVEVRAVNPPATIAPAQPVSRAPSLSLADYLKSRNQGR